MNIRGSSSLYSEGLIAIGEQDQEQGPWFNNKRSWRYSCRKQCLFHVKKQERNKTQTLMRVAAVNYRVLGITPLDAAPNGL